MKPGEGYEVTADLYDIAKRLREIDPDYRVWYSYRKHKYEIHNVGQRGGTYALTVPYGELDERTLRLVIRTRAENAAEFIREIERKNAALRKEKVRKAAERAAKNAEVALSAL